VERPTEVIYRDRRAVLTVRSAMLRVASGPDRGASCALDLQRVKVGTGAENHLVLTDARVSRQHLEFQVQDQGYLVQDLGSTNGTFYRGARIREAVVGPGAEIRLGETVLRVERGAEHTAAIEGKSSFGGLIGISPAMQEVYGVLAAVAPTDTTVLVEGETGTGKELVAEAIHHQSPRAGRLFSVLDCSALPASLIESELFGHERGAFTDAVATREGIFERTRGGTVFLDEIGELSLDLQTRLLRVLDRRIVKRLGGNSPRGVDVRLVAATNRDLAAEVQQGRFRQDLFYRLAVVRVVMPPLRQRREDIPLLARHFLWQTGCPNPDAVLTPTVLEALHSRSWPGNVRELRNVVERAVIFADGAVSGSDAEALLAPEVAPAEAPAPEPPVGDGWLAQVFPADLLDRPYKEVKEEVIGQLERLYLGALFRRHGNNISAIARDAGVDRHLVRILLRKHGML
jgi:transcriptional regulator with GAF, ATPase, and Fis domain